MGLNGIYIQVDTEHSNLSKLPRLDVKFVNDPHIHYIGLKVYKLMR